MLPEVREWVAAVVAEKSPQAPVLEIGSYDVNGTVRDLFPEPYVGLDMRDGPGVDLVMDMIDNVLEPIFNTIVCCEMLEHCQEPIQALRNARESALPGAIFIGTWPYKFDEHDYPSDYWRVTRSGFRYVLEQAGFEHIDVALKWGTHVVATASVPR